MGTDKIKSLGNPKDAFGPLRDYQAYLGIKDYFENQLEKFSDQIALDYKSQRLKFSDLESKSNQLSHYLRSNGVSRNKFVGVYMDRSIEMFIAILATFKAGGAYVPLAPDYPPERLKLLLADLEAPICLTQMHLKKKLAAAIQKETRLLCVDEDWEKEIGKESSERLPPINQPEDAAYIIYTSGSTGAPKACVNTQRGLLNLIQWMDEKFPLSKDDKVLQKTVFTFDASVQEIISPLVSGATLVIAEPEGHKDPSYLVKTIREKSITNIQLVPSMLHILLEEPGLSDCKSLKRVFVGGEPLTTALVKRTYEVLPDAKLINLYGPTEAAVDCTYWICSAAEKVVPIGWPAPNCAIYILNENGQPVDRGVVGELFIGGPQVAMGYWKRDSLTAERFLPDPFSSVLNARMYRTGDSGRFLENGAIECLGRLDLQVKIRGFRVELGEIEAVLVQHQSIGQAATVLKQLHGKDDGTEKSIVAYYVNKVGSKTDPVEIKDFLKAKLPEYMVPAAVVCLESLPLMANGKADRQALIAYSKDIKPLSEDPAMTSTSDAPNGPIEISIAKVWQKVLKVNNVSRSDNYFSLGGDSLSIIRAVRQLKELNFNLEIKDLYLHQTIGEIAKLVLERQASLAQNEHGTPKIQARSRHSQKNIFSLSFEQDLYWKQTISKKMNTFVGFVNSLTGPLDVSLLKKSIDAIMQRHWALKSKLVIDPNGKSQVISVVETDYFLEIDLRNLPEDEREAALIEKLLEQPLQAIDVQKCPPFRCFLNRVFDDQYFFVVSIEHFFSDFLSAEIVRKELSELYTAGVENRAPSLPEISHQYVDYAAWQKDEWAACAERERRLSYWRNNLRDLPIFELPKDLPVSSENLNANLQNPLNGFRILRTIDTETWRALIKYCKKQKASMYDIVVAGFSRTLHRWSGQKEVVFPTVMSQRPPEFENNVGFFMSFLPLRIDFSDNPNTSALLNKVKLQTQNAQINLLSQIELSELVKTESEPVRRAFSNAYSILFHCVELPKPLEFPQVEVENIEFENDGEMQLNQLAFGWIVGKETALYYFGLNMQFFSKDSVAKFLDLFDEYIKEISAD